MSLPLEAEILLFNVRCELEDKRLECEVLKLRIAELEVKLDGYDTRMRIQE